MRFTQEPQTSHNVLLSLALYIVNIALTLSKHALKSMNVINWYSCGFEVFFRVDVISLNFSNLKWLWGIVYIG